MSTTALDSNILSGLLSNELSVPTILQRLASCRMQGSHIICPIVFAELSAYPGMTPLFLDDFLLKTGILVDYELGKDVWAEAGSRFALYAARRRKSAGGNPRGLVADFVVGAHALLRADRLLTFDTALYRRNFPGLELA